MDLCIPEHLRDTDDEPLATADRVSMYAAENTEIDYEMVPWATAVLISDDAASNSNANGMIVAVPVTSEANDDNVVHAEVVSVQADGVAVAVPVAGEANNGNVEYVEAVLLD